MVMYPDHNINCKKSLKDLGSFKWSATIDLQFLGQIALFKKMTTYLQEVN